MSKSRQDDTGQDLKNPLLGLDDDVADERPQPVSENPPPPAEPQPRRSSTVEISRLFEHAAKSQSEKEGIREGFYMDENTEPQRYKVDESDYESHRTTDYPRVQPILGNMHPVQVKKGRKVSAASPVAPSLPDVSEDPSSDSEASENEPLMSKTPLSALYEDPPRPMGEYTILPAVTVSSPIRPRPRSGSTDAQGVRFSIGGDHEGQGSAGQLSFLNDLGQLNDPLVSEGQGPTRLEPPHVKFSVGSSGSLDKPPSGQEHNSDAILGYEDERPRKKHSTGNRRSSASKGNKNAAGELAARRHRGSDLKAPTAELPTEKDEAKMLVGSDLADMAAHRFHDARGLRRHLVSPNAMVSISHQSSDNPDDIKPNLIIPRRMFDHEPHEMFVELDELLLTNNEEYEWQEKARWIKFEEDVEENLSRWGKPHVASLSFHSLLELRQCIESGVILLDLEEEDLPSIVTRLVDQLVTEDLLDPEQKGLIIRALLLKHRHVNEGGFALRRPSVANVGGGERRPSVMNFFRSQSVVSNKTPSPYVLRKGDLKGSTGSDMNNLENGSSSTSHSRQDKRKKSHIRLDAPGIDPHPTSAMNGDSHNNIKNKMFNNVLQQHGHHRVSFSTVPDVVQEDRIPIGDEEKSFANDIHAIHTVAPPILKSRSSQVSAPFFKPRMSTVSAPFLKQRMSTVSAPILKPRMSTVSLASEASTRMDGDGGGYNGIIRRIPKGAEATTVLVGNVELLSQPIMAFVRLSEGRYLGNVTEVNLPVRFIFLLMGPSNANLDYHEIGRSISTLMANTSFHDVAYRAEDRVDLLDAINEFLDDSIVLPPGEWNKETLLPIIDMKKKKQEVKEEKEKKERKLSLAAPAVPLVAKRNPLQRTKMPFGGAINDFKERLPHYLSDFKDGLSTQCVSTFVFIYFACLSPAITFGGLLSEKVKGWIGVSEMILSCGAFGVIFSMLASQPITICGFTGPLLVWEEGIYKFTLSVGLDYMAWRFWSLFWMFIIVLVLTAFEGAILVKFITRFTEEIFAFLISLIFIVETFMKLASIFKRHPLMKYYPPPWCMGGEPTTHSFMNDTWNDTLIEDTLIEDTITTTAWSETMSTEDPFADDITTLLYNLTSPKAGYSPKAKPKNQPNTAMFSLILCLSTYVLATELKKFRNSQYLGRSARRALGDFGVPISILVFCLVAYGGKAVYTEKLSVPDGLTPTAAERRGWYISPLGHEKPLPIWAMFAGIIPGFLVFILVFMETQITSIILNKPERNLRKGSGTHSDIFLLGCWALICGFVGLPVLCGATVRSVTHMSSLSVFSRSHAPGDKPVLEKVLEQRLTNLCVHILMFLSLLLGPILRQVPLAVLFGVFLYMGISSLGSLQFFDRILILTMPRKYHGDAPYVKKVRPWKMHMFTVMQFLSLAVLWAVKSTEGSLAFPFVLIATIPLRYFVMKHMFTKKELRALDGNCKPEDEDNEPDFYEQAHNIHHEEEEGDDDDDDDDAKKRNN